MQFEVSLNEWRYTHRCDSYRVGGMVTLTLLWVYMIFRGCSEVSPRKASHKIVNKSLYGGQLRNLKAICTKDLKEDLKKNENGIFLRVYMFERMESMMSTVLHLNI